MGGLTESQWPFNSHHCQSEQFVSPGVVYLAGSFAFIRSLFHLPINMKISFLVSA